MHNIRKKALGVLACGVSALLLGGCVNDDYGVPGTVSLGGNAHLALTFVTSGDASATRATRASAYEADGYEEGIEHENYIDIYGGDYRIYFFTNEEGDEKGGKLIAEFKPESVTSSSTSSTTTYTVIGDVPEELKNESNFRVVMLANWGWWYPSVTAGTTTIYDLCEGSNATFYADRKFVIDEDNLIPFYGVQEYSGVTFADGATTNLSTPVSLLRAVAKVEVILTADSDVDAFGAVSIVNYNSQGYKAPAGVYVAADYDTEMKMNPNTTGWPYEWIKGLHLVNGKNDTDSKTQSFTQITGATQDTWRIYLPEYDNSDDTDYSYMTVTIGGEPYEIYFADYEDGVTDNTNSYDLKRNNIYRYYVTYKDRELRVFVETWENVFDNEWKFGEEFSHLIYADDDINNFTADDGYIYASLVKEGDEDNPTVYLQKVSATTSGYVRIPETVTYMGYTYTVVGIGSYCFDADEGVTFIDIPGTVTYIESEAFHGDIGLEGIAIHSETPPECAVDAFEDDTLEKVTLYVPTDAENTYKNHEVWGNFGFKEIFGIDFTY